MSEPFIYESSAHYSLSENLMLRTPAGVHAMFAAEVPFLPSLMSADFVGPLAAGSSRLQLIIDRQIRFINDLAGIKRHSATFDLRLLFRAGEEDSQNNPAQEQPERQQPGITVLFVGKTFTEGHDKGTARRHALKIFRMFRGHFPLEDPFNYPLVPIDAAWLEDKDERLGLVHQGLNEAFQRHVLTPVPLDDISNDQLSEIRKFEDCDSLVSTVLGAPTRDASRNEPKLGYHVHPFRPTLDISGFSRLLETLTEQQQTCLLRISIRPTWLTGVELRLLNRLQSEYADQLQHAEGWVAQYKQAHLDRMQAAFRDLIAHQRHLFTVNIQVIGSKHRPHDLIASLGSEFMNNSSATPQTFSEYRPRPDTDDLDIAKGNLRYLEHELWGEGARGSKLNRIPVLVSGHEAAGAFRLPIPPESGFMPGIAVQDEPFVQLQQTNGAKVDSLNLGHILHRGTPTDETFSLSLSDLRRHVLVAGATGSGKTFTCLHLLSQLWNRADPIPFLVIYPVAKQDYRSLMTDPAVRDDLLIFTTGDRASPFRFNPFDIPEGVLLRTHISNMMRTFSAGMHMWGPLPSLFKAALRQLYEKHGWQPDARSGDDPAQRIPTLVDFHEELKALAVNWSDRYRADLRGDLRQDSEVKVRDLLETAGDVLNVQQEPGMPSLLEQILEKPTVIELGRIGSASDIALVVGFLVSLITEHVFSRYQKNRNKLQHVTLIEEAHRLMSAQVAVQGEHVADPRQAGAEEFAHILSEVRGYGEAVIIAEQTPTKLVADAIANTHIKIMHKLDDQQSFELFALANNLNDRQRQHARTLQPGEAIVRGKSGYPALVKVPFYEDIIRDRCTTKTESDSEELHLPTGTDDDDVQHFMRIQSQRHGLTIPPARPFRQARSVPLTANTERRPVRQERVAPASKKSTIKNTGRRDERIEAARQERLRKTIEKLGKTRTESADTA